MRALGFLLTTPFLAGAATFAQSSIAHACGGTFCDANLPGQMSVDQTGENILFVLDGDHVEAHVQIQYDGGNASQFAWIVPVPEVPEIEVGAWRLVQNVLDATVPVYGFEDGEQCNMGPMTTGAGFLSMPDGGAGSGPEVLAKDIVGAFEYVVLQGGTAQGVMQWLADNGYAPDDDAPDILDAYIDEGHVFVAFKLRHGAQIEDIHPVVIRYPGDEACIPIRLTRVAARDDMDIRALFLGDARVMPLNYAHVRPNRARLDWVNLGTNYEELVGRAVDEAGGRAFVTEYAGSSDIVATENLQTEALDPSVFETAGPIEAIELLAAQDLMACYDLSCDYRHELVPSLVHEFIPVPEGMEDHEFYGCMSCNAALIDGQAWDGAAFAAAYQERIVAPLDHARDLLAMWPHVTRLYTRISPHEMLSDPLFEEVPELEDVPNRHGAERNRECCGTHMRLPGGRRVYMETNGTWPTFPEAMPWAERIEEFQPAGPPVTVVDNTSLIDELLDAHNQQNPCVSGGSTTGGGAPGRDDGTGDGASTTGETDGGSGGLKDGGPSCGCRTSDRGALAVWALGLLGLCGARRGRR